MSNGKKRHREWRYFTSQDKSLIAPPLSKDQAAVEEIAKAYRQHKRKTSDDVAFNSMQKATPELSVMEADKTRADLSGYKADKSTADVHNALLAAGMTPVLGNIADAVDALLYAIEGEFGEAGLSLAAIVPMAGQMVTAKRALKAAKESGEEIVTLYRGVRGIDDVNVMVKKGKVVGNWEKTFDPSKAVGKDLAEQRGRKVIDSVYGASGPMVTSVPKNVDITNTLFTSWKKNVGKIYSGESGGMLLEFEVPVSWINKHGRDAFGRRLSREGTGWGTSGLKKTSDMGYPSIIFTEGLPTVFIKNVHK